MVGQFEDAALWIQRNLGFTGTMYMDKIQKQKRETKEVGMEIHPRKGVLKEEKFPNTRKHSHQQVCGEFWNLRGQHNWEEK